MKYNPEQYIPVCDLCGKQAQTMRNVNHGKNSLRFCLECHRRILVHYNEVQYNFDDMNYIL